MCDRLLPYIHTFALLNKKKLLSCIPLSLWVIKRISISAPVLEQILFYVIYFWTLSFNFVFMCPKNMLLLKSGKGDQICQICLDLHHLHTNYINFPGEDPRTPLFFSGASRPRIRLASLGIRGPPSFSLSKSGPSLKTVGHPCRLWRWHIHTDRQTDTYSHEPNTEESLLYFWLFLSMFCVDRIGLEVK